MHITDQTIYEGTVKLIPPPHSGLPWSFKNIHINITKKGPKGSLL